MVEFAPSILAADFTRLAEEIEKVKRARYLHFDVMDGHFVPNLTVGIPVLKSLKGRVPQLLDVHLMMDNPDHLLEKFIDAGADMVTVHAEVTPHLHRTLSTIKKHGAQAGVALNPHTPVVQIEGMLEILDLVLVMTVNPGFGGQDFIAATLNKVRELRARIDAQQLDCLLQVDGGINTKTAPLAVEAGADILVAGSAVFGQPRPEMALQDLIASTAGC